MKKITRTRSGLSKLYQPIAGFKPMEANVAQYQLNEIKAGSTTSN
jgi:hypothetical protein